jgi:hypothetical protein
VLRKAELLVVVAAIAVTVGLTITDPGSDRRPRERRDVEVVQRAADRLTYATIADAWQQARLGATAALSAIAETIDVRYLSTHQEADAIILTFHSPHSRCGIFQDSSPGRWHCRRRYRPTVVGPKQCCGHWA